MARELASHRLREEEVAAWRTCHEDLLAAVSVAHVSLDREGRMLTASPAATALLGIDGVVLVKMLFTTFLSGADAEGFTTARAEVVRGSGVRSCVVVFRNRGGDLPPVRVRASLVAAPGDTTSCVLAVDHEDATPDALEVHHGRKLQALGALVSGIAHDYNNVLQALVACSTLAADEKTTLESARALMRSAKDIALRGGSLVHQLTGFSRKQQPKVAPLLLDATVEKVAKLIQAVVGEHIEVAFEAGARGVRIRVDRAQIEQVLLNLASNARDAMPEGGRLSLRTEVAFEGERRCVRLIVRDTGCGFDDATATRVFEPFYTTKEVGRGTGLGLANVRAVLDALGGSVQIASKPGAGTTVVLELPPCEDLQVTRARVQDGLRLSGTVVLVEDDPIVRQSMHDQLDELGLDVLDAMDVEHATELCVTQNPRLLVTDVLMPRMTGTTLAALVRGRLPDLRVLFVSGDPGGGLDLDALPAGTRFLWKPFGREALGSALRALLIEPTARRAPESGVVELAPPSVVIPARPRKVLVVEDDPSSRDGLRKLLEQTGYAVIAVGSAAEALSVAGREPIDILLTDMRLPGESGDELAAEMQRRQPGIPVIYLSGDRPPVEGRRSGTFLTKPIEVDALLEIMATMPPSARPRA